MNQLGKAYFFRNLDPAELKALKAVARIAEVKDGERILSQGETSDELFIVRSGSVSVLVPGAAGSESEVLARLGPGECFGEFAFIDRKPSSASVVAAGDASIYAVAHSDLERQLDSNPMTAAKFYRSLLDVLVARFRNTDVELARRRGMASGPPAGAAG